MPSTAVYVTSNDPRAEANAVLALRRPAGGTLQQLGAFPTRGRGVVNPGSQFDTEDFDQVVHIDPHRRLLFAANGGSDSIAVFAIDTAGRLSHVEGSPFDAGGVQPVSVGVNGQYAFVVNKDRDPDRPATSSRASYVSFRLSDSGQLSAGTTVEVPAGSSPSQALVAAVSSSAPIFELACSSRSGSVTTAGSISVRRPRSARRAHRRWAWPSTPACRSSTPACPQPGESASTPSTTSAASPQ